MNGTADIWRVTPEERSRHDTQFAQLGPANGFVTGDKARAFFMQSGLPVAVLGHIWNLSDYDADGKLSAHEFSIAMHLVKCKLEGKELPGTLPPSLRADSKQSTPASKPFGDLLTGFGASSFASSSASSSTGSTFGLRPQPSVYGPNVGTPMSNSGSMNQLGTRSRQDSLVGATAMPVGQMGPVAPVVGMMAPAVQASVPMGTGDAWAVPVAARRKYTQQFNEVDKQKRGWLNGSEARTVLMQSGLATQILADVWNLADVDANGRLTNDEFVLALYLIELARAGQKLPPKLPPELVPLSLRPGGATAAPQAPLAMAGFPAQPQMGPMPTQMQMQPQPHMGVMPGAPPMQMPMQMQMQMPMQMPMQMQPPVAVVGQSQNGAAEQNAAAAPDLEAKRRENFLKGQEELARRQEALKEQLRREEEARREKQRAEEERLQREREERERARLAELERQRERARQLELERQEAMRREQEAREHARRELEMRRLVDQLTMERSREQQAIEQAKLIATNLKSECENIATKKTEIASKIDQARVSVTDYTNIIESMRRTRDTLVAELNEAQAEADRIAAEYERVRRTRAELNVQSQQLVAPALADEHQRLLNTHGNKQLSVQRLKMQVEQLESDAKRQRVELEKQQAVNTELRTSMATLKTETMTMRSDLRVRLGPEQPAIEPVASDAAASKWDAFSTLNDQFAATKLEAAPPAGAHDGVTYYRALFEFDSRNPDELRFAIGDILVVRQDEQGPVDPGWLKGESLTSGQVGLFPENYVEVTIAPPSASSAFQPFKKQTKPETNHNLASSTTGWPEAAEPQADYLNFDVNATNAEILKAVALQAYVADDKGQLSFTSGAQISVTQQAGEWWYGETAGQAGWFPKSFVQTQAEYTAAAAAGAGDSATLSGKEYCLALFAYTGEPGDLQFNEGDLIEIADRSSTGWWTGLVCGRSDTGQFPENYVRIVSLAEARTAAAQKGVQLDSKPVASTASVPSAATAAVSSVTPTDAAAQSRQAQTTTTTAAAAAAATAAAAANVKKPEICMVLTDYVAQSENQLTLKKGQMIMIKRRDDSDWWEGELQARGQKKQTGLFLASNVKLMGGTDKAEKQAGRQTPDQSGAAQKSVSPVAGSHAAADAAAGAEKAKVRALYAYTAANADELTFSKDELLLVIDNVTDPEWWECESTATGKRGLVPNNYVKQLD